MDRHNEHNLTGQPGYGWDMTDKPFLTISYAEHRRPFDEIKHRHTLKEVGDIAEGVYDWNI